MMVDVLACPYCVTVLASTRTILALTSGLRANSVISVQQPIGAALHSFCWSEMRAVSSLRLDNHTNQCPPAKTTARCYLCLKKLHPTTTIHY
jgi:hypothetical protein